MFNYKTPYYYNFKRFSNKKQCVLMQFRNIKCKFSLETTN